MLSGIVALAEKVFPAEKIKLMSEKLRKAETIRANLSETAHAGELPPAEIREELLRLLDVLEEE